MTVPIFCHNISTGLIDHETSNTSSLNSFQLLWHVQIQEKLQIFSFSRLEREGEEGHIHWHSVLLVSKSWFPSNLNQRMSQSTQLCFQLSLGHNTLWNKKIFPLGKFWHLRNQLISPGKIQTKATRGFFFPFYQDKSNLLNTYSHIFFINWKGVKQLYFAPKRLISRNRLQTLMSKVIQTFSHYQMDTKITQLCTMS